VTFDRELYEDVESLVVGLKMGVDWDVDVPR
jgi:hypothetical protein